MSAPVTHSTARAIEWLAGQLVERDDEIASLRAALAQRDRVIVELQAGVVAYRAVLGACRAAVADALVGAPWQITDRDIETARTALAQEHTAAVRAVRGTT